MSDGGRHRIDPISDDSGRHRWRFQTPPPSNDSTGEPNAARVNPPIDATADEPAPTRRGKVLSRLALIRDVGFVSFGQYGQYIVTLVTLPIIARFLGPAGVGHLAIGTSAYFLGSLAVDLGLITFLAAQVDAGRLKQLRGDYLTIRALVMVVLTTGFILATFLDVNIHVYMIAFGAFAGGVSSMGENWVLIGRSKFGTVVLSQSVGRIGYLVLILTWLPHHRTAPVALACVLFSSLIPVVWTWVYVNRRYGNLAAPTDLRGIATLGAPVLASRMLENTYEQGVATLFSWVLPSTKLGMFSASDRIVQAVSSLLDAIGYGLLPRLAKRKNDDNFWHSIRRTLYAIAGLALTASVGIAIVAPFAVPVIFGSEFDNSITILQVEAFVLPGTAVASFITTAVLPIFRDTRGILVGSLIGTVIIVGFLGVAIANRSVWTIVLGMIAAETVVSAFYLWRIGWLTRTYPRAAESFGEAQA